MKLGEETIDIPTGATVTPISLWVLDKEGLNRRICVQPRGLNPETKAPLPVFWVTDDRLQDGPIENRVPSHLIGEQAECRETGFKGTIVQMCIHKNGCIHADIQPKGVQKDGSIIGEQNFDLRCLKGPKIPEWSVTEREMLAESHPSPSGTGTLGCR